MLQRSISDNGEIPKQFTSVVFTNLIVMECVSTKHPIQESQLASPTTNEHERQCLGLYSLSANTGQQLTRWSTVSSAKPQSLHLAEL